MGSYPVPSPSSSHPPQSRPSSSSPPALPKSLSGVDSWFLNSSDRDTQLLTQALTRELSSCSRGPISSSVLPPPPATSASFSSSSSLYETFSRCLEGRPWQSQSSQALFAVKALQQQEQQQQNHHQQQQAAAMSSMRLRGDGLSHVEQNSLQKGSPLSSNSSAPASPFSTSTNSAMSTIATDSFLAHSKPNDPQHQHSEDGRFARSMASDSSLSSKAASVALSSPASVGTGGSKVNKRRSRASNKAPIAVLSADTSNFRAMVQQLTGIPSIQSYTHSGIPLLKPQPIRHPLTSTSNLPTLDTSACFLGPKYMKEGFSHQLSSSSAANLNLRGVQCHNVENTLQSHLPRYVRQSDFNEQANSINYSLASSSPSLWSSPDSLNARGNFSSLYEGEQISVMQNSILTPTTLDNLPMEEHLASKSSFNGVDTWLSFDGALANHAPNMELARMA